MLAEIVQPRTARLLLPRRGDLHRACCCRRRINLLPKTLYATNVTADTGTLRGLTASSTLTAELCAIKSDGAQVCLTGDLVEPNRRRATPISVPSSPSISRELRRRARGFGLHVNRLRGRRAAVVP